MKQHKKSDQRRMALVNQSFIISLLRNLIDSIYRMFSGSLIFGAFTSADTVQHHVNKSLISRSLTKTTSKMAMSDPRYRLISAIENSHLYKAYCRFIRQLLSKSLRSYGIFFLSFGGYGIIVYLIKMYAIKPEGDLIKYLVIPCVFAICGFVLFMSDKKLSLALKEGRMTRFILFRLLGLREVALYTEGSTDKKSMGAFTLGMVCGLLTLIAEPERILFILACLVATALIMYSPEAGLLIMIIGLPYLKTRVLIFGIIVVSFSYFFKLIRGKRNFSLSPSGVCAAIFAFSLLLSGLTGVGGASGVQAMLVSLCFLWSFFLAANLFSSESLVTSAFSGILISAFGVIAIGIGEYLLGLAPQKWLDLTMFSDISGRVVSTFENPNVLGEYLILTLPLFFALFTFVKGFRAKTGTVLLIFASLACLYFTWSRGAWISAAFALVVIALLSSKKNIIRFAYILLLLPLIVTLIEPTGFWHRLSSIGNLADSSTAYRVYIWKAALEMVKSFFGTGIGVGIDAFGKVYIGYSYAGIEAAPHSHSLYLQLLIEGGIIHLLAFGLVMFFLLQECFTKSQNADSKNSKQRLYACICGIIAFLVMGLFDYTFYNFRIQLFFWSFCGLTIASAKNIERKTSEESYSFVMR